MANTFLSGSNPVLVRELRAGLRNTRAFALLAIYVALLGAIVTVAFPASVQIDLQSDGGAKGQELFRTLVYGQVLLILALIPALATGALSQERERQTLEPLLMTPMSPLQIVWGKAGGVLSLVGLLLLASLPLTSLCFLLGGVSPGMLIAAYAGILGLAVFTTGLGLYCAARWANATRSLVACYALLPIALSLVMVFLPLGALFSGICVLLMLVYGLTQGLKKGETTSFARRIGPVYGKLVYILAPLMIGGLLVAMRYDRNIGLIAVGVGFILSYFVMAAQWGLLQTAKELMTRSDPEAPMRQKVADLKKEWQSALTTPTPSTYTPAPQTQSEWAALTATPTPQPATAASKKVPPKAADSYGKAPFLSDKLNPIYARELRSGLLGKFEYLFRFSYVLTILTELALFGQLLMGLYDPTYLSTDYTEIFALWGRWHLALVMVFGAWFGARAIAPEREGQTLPQLFTIPLLPRQIIGGKLAAVLTFTFYVQVLALPLALLLPLTGLIPWMMALQFLMVETALGTLAAAWGVYCSFHSATVRRALSWALGGVSSLLIAHVLIEPFWEILRLLGAVEGRGDLPFFISMLPMPLLFPQDIRAASGLLQSAPSVAMSPLAPFAALLYLAAAALLMLQTARDFKKLAQEA